MSCRIEVYYYLIEDVVKVANISLEELGKFGTVLDEKYFILLNNEYYDGNPFYSLLSYIREKFGEEFDKWVFHLRKPCVSYVEEFHEDDE